MPSRGVVIIGGGMGGLCAAIALRQAGLEVALAERDAGLRGAGTGPGGGRRGGLCRHCHPPWRSTSFVPWWATTSWSSRRCRSPRATFSAELHDKLLLGRECHLVAVVTAAG